MAITETQYKDMKPYWDFQRLQEYNKEMIKDCLLYTSDAADE